MKLSACRLVVIASVLFAVTTVWSAERAWQTGVWRDVQVKRPKVVFGVAPNRPETGGPRTSPPASQEERTYVIETDTMRLELKEVTTVDAPRVDVLVGEPVTFAIDKKTVYIKEANGRERKLSVTKRSAK